MKKAVFFLSMVGMLTSPVFAPEVGKNLEFFIYQENFESGELNAWASYPLWQDTAFDPNMRVAAIVPGDPNISLAERVTPYTNVDNYAGAQKKLDAYFVPGSSVKLRYYLKTQLEAEFFKIRIAAGKDGKVDLTISNPATNRWEWVEATYDDFIGENPGLSGKNIKVNALAVLAKIPKADPAMPIFFGLDDITFKGAKTIEFKFIEPRMLKLSEWKPFIASNHYKRDDSFILRGKWPLIANRVTLEVVNFIDRSRVVFNRDLKRSGEEWSLEGLKLSFPEGLYLGRLEAYQGKENLSDTEFTIYVAPGDIGRKHPRLWFDKEKLSLLKSKLQDERFKKIGEDILKNAKEAREKFPLGSVFFDVDNFPDDEPLLGNVPRSIYPWFERVNAWRRGIHDNSLAYALFGDRQAGEYAKSLMMKLCGFPFWLHPWFKKRGQHIYYPVGELAMDLALGYDFIYEVMDEKERMIIRQALKKQIIEACHKSYVEDNLVTSNTSNWIAHITGGSLMSQAAIFGDGQDIGEVEPYFTGVIFKMDEFIRKAFGSDGAYGESYGYYNFTMQSLSKCLPAAENVFKIDLSGKVDGSYNELVWAGLIKNKKFFHFGDSGGDLNPMTSWAWLLPKYKDPLLGWLYHFMKKEESLFDVIYETDEIPRKEPFGENPVRCFLDVGTTVLKSGWEKDDFVFVLRTGAFYNHQHLDQGTFWLADQGSVFIGERHGSTYYDDPIYQSHYTQPVAHSTILINGNEQSQRVGDPLQFIEGFDDHAFVFHFLDGTDIAFVSGDISRLYWGKAKEIKRNVLYIKPKTLLILDTIVPGEEDIEVSLLFQTDFLKDIQPGKEKSLIKKGENMLTIRHLHPENLDVRAVETPHYFYTLKNERPLIEEGMLTVSARTRKEPLVIASLLHTARETEINIQYKRGDGFVTGKAAGKNFAFHTRPGTIYSVDKMRTDALALTWDEEKIFACLGTNLEKDGKTLIQSKEPITVEFLKNRFKYYLAQESPISIGIDGKPQRVMVNNKIVNNFEYDSRGRRLNLNLPKGEGSVYLEISVK